MNKNVREIHVLLSIYNLQWNAAVKVGPLSGRNGDGNVIVFAKNVANGPEMAKT